jgi:competence protein ComGF
MMIISITTSSIKDFVSSNFIKNSLNRLEWDNFVCEVQKEVNRSLSQTIYSEMLFIEDQYHVSISYGKYGSIIRRQKLGTGQQIVLQNIKSINFTKNGQQQIIIKVEDLNGHVYERTIRLFENGNQKT